ncbi:MAG: hypothetical protein WB554_02805, partial [Desulfomonilaceae bacterium]
MTVQGVIYARAQPGVHFVELVTLGQKEGPLMSGSFIERCLESGLHIRDQSFENYLRDESRFTGHAEALITAYFESDITKTILLCNETHTPLTVVSGKTSLT